MDRTGDEGCELCEENRGAEAGRGGNGGEGRQQGRERKGKGKERGGRGGRAEVPLIAVLVGHSARPSLDH